MEFILESLEHTRRLGSSLGKIALPGDVYTMEGSLGAGKTTLTQCIGRGLGVPDDCYITSPTFSLMHEYSGRIPLYHMDLYRLSTEELFELGFEDYIYGEGLTIIEWPDRLGELQPVDYLQIVLHFTSETTRTVELTAHGSFGPRLEDWDPEGLLAGDRK